MSLLPVGLLGLALGALAFPLISVGLGEVGVAAAVAVAMVVASCIATSVAMLLPWTLRGSAKMPAFGSDRSRRVVQDLMTVTVYFLTAAAIAT